MSQQLAVHKNTQHPLDALWWKPIFSTQNEINQSLKQMVDQFMQPFGGAPAALLDTEENAFNAFQRNTHRMFSELFNNRQLATPWLNGTMTEPYVDIIENGKSFKIRADVPGLNAKDLEVSISDSAITISGERCEDKQEKDGTYLRRECHCGAFSRTIALPEEANMDKASASFEQNVLTVEIPKKQAAQQKEQGRKLNIEGSASPKKAEPKSKAQPDKQEPEEVQSKTPVKPELVGRQTASSSSPSKEGDTSKDKKTNAA